MLFSNWFTKKLCLFGISCWGRVEYGTYFELSNTCIPPHSVLLLTAGMGYMGAFDLKSAKAGPWKLVQNESLASLIVPGSGQQVMLNIINSP